MKLKHYKNLLLLIQQGKVDNISNEDLETVLSYLIDCPAHKYDIKVLSDGSTLFSKVVLNALLHEKSKRSVKV